MVLITTELAWPRRRRDGENEGRLVVEREQEWDRRIVEGSAGGDGRWDADDGKRGGWWD